MSRYRATKSNFLPPPKKHQIIHSDMGDRNLLHRSGAPVAVGSSPGGSADGSAEAAPTAETEGGPC